MTTSGSGSEFSPFADRHRPAGPDVPPTAAAAQAELSVLLRDRLDPLGFTRPVRPEEALTRDQIIDATNRYLTTPRMPLPPAHQVATAITVERTQVQAHPTTWPQRAVGPPNTLSAEHVIERPPHPRRAKILMGCTATALVLTGVGITAKVYEDQHGETTADSASSKAHYKIQAKRGAVALPSAGPTSLNTQAPEATPSVAPTETAPTLPVAPSEAPTVAPPVPTPTPTPSQELVAGPVRNLMSLNIYYDTNDNDKQWSEQDMPKRMALSVGMIEKQDISLIQEVRQDQNTLLNQMLPKNFQVFPQGYDDRYANQNRIVVNTDIYAVLDSFTIPGPQVTQPGVHPDSATMVIVKDKVSGAISVAICEHANVEDDQQGQQARYDVAVARANFVKAIQNRDPSVDQYLRNVPAGAYIHIISGGDENSGYGAGPSYTHPTYENDPQNTWYCVMMNKGNLVDAADGFDHRNDKTPPTTCDPRVLHIVDHLDIDRDTTVSSFDYAGPPHTVGSDVHNALVVKIQDLDETAAQPDSVTSSGSVTERTLIGATR